VAIGLPSGRSARSDSSRGQSLGEGAAIDRDPHFALEPDLFQCIGPLRSPTLRVLPRPLDALADPDAPRASSARIVLAGHAKSVAISITDAARLARQITRSQKAGSYWLGRRWTRARQSFVLLAAATTLAYRRPHFEIDFSQAAGGSCQSSRRGGVDPHMAGLPFAQSVTKRGAVRGLNAAERTKRDDARRQTVAQRYRHARAETEARRLDGPVVTL
jgi:hypothetical protein